MVQYTVIPRIVWRADCNPWKIDQARRSVNGKVGRARSDGVHLSNAVLDLFLQILKGSLCAKAFGCGGGQGAYK